MVIPHSKQNCEFLLYFSFFQWMCQQWETSHKLADSILLTLCCYLEMFLKHNPVEARSINWRWMTAIKHSLWTVPNSAASGQNRHQTKDLNPNKYSQLMKQSRLCQSPMYMFCQLSYTHIVIEQIFKQWKHICCLEYIFINNQSYV